MRIDADQHLETMHKALRVAARKWRCDADEFMGEAYEALREAADTFSFWRSRGMGFERHAYCVIVQRLNKLIPPALGMRKVYLDTGKRYPNGAKIYRTVWRPSTVGDGELAECLAVE